MEENKKNGVKLCKMCKQESGIGRLDCPACKAREKGDVLPLKEDAVCELCDGSGIMDCPQCKTVMVQSREAAARSGNIEISDSAGVIDTFNKDVPMILIEFKSEDSVEFNAHVRGFRVPGLVNTLMYMVADDILERHPAFVGQKAGFTLVDDVANRRHGVEVPALLVQFDDSKSVGFSVFVNRDFTNIEEHRRQLRLALIFIKDKARWQRFTEFDADLQKTMMEQMGNAKRKQEILKGVKGANLPAGLVSGR